MAMKKKNKIKIATKLIFFDLNIIPKINKYITSIIGLTNKGNILCK